MGETAATARGCCRGWLVPRPGNLTYRLGQLKDAEAVADELYLSVLTRLPVADERREVAEERPDLFVAAGRGEHGRSGVHGVPFVKGEENVR